jgi:hypothetical protein
MRFRKFIAILTVASLDECSSQKMANQSLEPTSCAVMPRATLLISESSIESAVRSAARGMPAQAVAHLWRSAKKKMSLLDTAKDVYDLAKKGMTIELQEKLMELWEQALTLQEDNLKLRSRITELDEKARLKESMHFRAPFYFRDGDSVPFCPVCWERDGKPIHMRAYTGDGDDRRYHTCGVCNLTEQNQDWKSRTRR